MLTLRPAQSLGQGAERPGTIPRRETHPSCPMWDAQLRPPCPCHPDAGAPACAAAFSEEGHQYGSQGCKEAGVIKAHVGGPAQEPRPCSVRSAWGPALLLQAP